MPNLRNKNKPKNGTNNNKDLADVQVNKGSRKRPLNSNNLSNQISDSNEPLLRAASPKTKKPKSSKNPTRRDLISELNAADKIDSNNNAQIGVRVEHGSNRIVESRTISAKRSQQKARSSTDRNDEHNPPNNRSDVDAIFTDRVDLDVNEEDDFITDDDQADDSQYDNTSVDSSTIIFKEQQRNAIDQELTDTQLIQELQSRSGFSSMLKELVNEQVNEQLADHRKLLKDKEKELENLKTKLGKTSAQKEKTSKSVTGNEPSNILMKSPSDTTIYTPALKRAVIEQNDSNGRFRSPQIENNRLVKQISSFVENIRISEERKQQQATQKTRYDRPERGDAANRRESPQPGCSKQDDDELQDEDNNVRRTPEAQKVADRILINAEKFKASVEAPKGNYCDSNDDEFFHLTCHIDPNLKNKIMNGEFVDLEKLIPKGNRLVHRNNNDSSIRVLQKDGETFLTTGTKENNINSVRRWEQAFRIYAAIYSKHNPHRAAEIWQYVFVINTAAASFIWDNVADYDFVFRQLMAENPERSWAKTYTQMWTLAMRDRVIPKNNYNGGNNYNGKGNGYGNGSHNSGSNSSSNNGNNNHTDWRDRCCWKFNRSKCEDKNCKWDHRCKYCGGWKSHGSQNCNKKNKRN